MPCSLSRSLLARFPPYSVSLRPSRLYHPQLPHRWGSANRKPREELSGQKERVDVGGVFQAPPSSLAKLRSFMVMAPAGCVLPQGLSWAPVTPFLLGAVCSWYVVNLSRPQAFALAAATCWRPPAPPGWLLISISAERLPPQRPFVTTLAETVFLSPFSSPFHLI